MKSDETTDSIKREHQRQFPLKKLEALIRMAVDNRLSLLQVGDVKIIPTLQQQQPSQTLSLLKEAESKAGRPLTAKEREDEILFGPGGSVKDIEE